MIVGLRAELDLLDLDDRLIAAGLRLLLLFLVLVLAEVEDLAYRRLRLRVDLDEVEPLLLCFAKRFVGLKNPEHASVGVDDADFGNADAVIDANLVTALLLTRIEPGMTQCHVCSV